jgi:large subunit ribosomal protein L14
MLATRSKLNCADNSGAKSLVVIGLGKGTGKRFARLGDIVTCVVRGAIPNCQVKDHEIVQALIVRTKKETRRKDGTYVRFPENAAVIIDQSKAPRSSRIFGPIASEIKDRGFAKIISLAKEIV